MSYYLKELGEDDDEYSYSSEEYGEEDEYEQEYDDDEQVGEPEEQEPKPGSAIQIVSLSDKKTQQKKKSNNKVQHVLTNKKKEENVVMEITQEELDYYQQLKLYGIHGTDNKKKKNDTDGLSEQVSFKLDVLQSSKMFFESIKPSEVIIYSGNPKYEEQKKYILRHQHEISVQKPNAYRNTDEMIAGETVAPPLQTQETTHKFKAALVSLYLYQ
ncbi:hypothetical protein C9374_013591 [Naegleria lovaniensis]|uniref:Uncharacterized protein n=1 Tax=Naegleria lovaniensis TaxID=51637 RepID=A0AA88KQ38_NAELO|nr:uncharacterized protein C9374_013591 [Naegleria lovaniensis]KAG2392106.1 hypothetical protein C9374_013591 [Naegleria lovaniensis]